MKLFEQLDDETFILYAAKNYYNPVAIDAEEFYADLNRFKYIKKLISRYKNTGTLSERLLLNHFVVVFNVFGIQPGLRMLEYKIGKDNWGIIKPFLIYLKAIHNTEYPTYKMDSKVVEALRNI